MEMKETRTSARIEDKGNIWVQSLGTIKGKILHETS